MNQISSDETHKLSWLTELEECVATEKDPLLWLKSSPFPSLLGLVHDVKVWFFGLFLPLQAADDLGTKQKCYAFALSHHTPLIEFFLRILYSICGPLCEARGKKVIGDKLK